MGMGLIYTHKHAYTQTYIYIYTYTNIWERNSVVVDSAPTQVNYSFFEKAVVGILNR